MAERGKLSETLHLVLDHLALAREELGDRPPGCPRLIPVSRPTDGLVFTTSFEATNKGFRDAKAPRMAPKS